MFMFTLNMGHPPKHAADYLRVLKKRNAIHYEGLSPKITFDALIDKRNSHVIIKWIAR